jgi:hypothetical protein
MPRAHPVNEPALRGPLSLKGLKGRHSRVTSGQGVVNTRIRICAAPQVRYKDDCVSIVRPGAGPSGLRLTPKAFFDTGWFTRDLSGKDSIPDPQRPGKRNGSNSSNAKGLRQIQPRGQRPGL